MELSREQSGMLHISYELGMCCLSASRMFAARDRDERNAFLESELVHARNLFEFLIAERSNPRSDDMLRTQFAPEWTPNPSGAVQRLKDRQKDIHKHVAHLTWARVDEAEALEEWQWVQVARDTLDITSAWVEHVTSSEGKDLDDPDITSLVLLNEVEDGRRLLAKLPGQAMGPTVTSTFLTSTGQDHVWTTQSTLGLGPR